jgi:hypothetical protein
VVEKNLKMLFPTITTFSKHSLDGVKFLSCTFQKWGIGGLAAFMTLYMHSPSFPYYSRGYVFCGMVRGQTHWPGGGRPIWELKRGLQYLFHSVLLLSLTSHSLWDFPFPKGWNGHYIHEGLAIIPCTGVRAFWGPM